MATGQLKGQSKRTAGASNDRPVKRAKVSAEKSTENPKTSKGRESPGCVTTLLSDWALCCIDHESLDRSSKICA